MKWLPPPSEPICRTHSLVLALHLGDLRVLAHDGLETPRERRAGLRRESDSPCSSKPTGTARSIAARTRERLSVGRRP